MYEAIEEYDHNGRTIRIVPDYEPESPREWDNLGTMIVRHSRYTLGDRDFEENEAEAMHRGFDVFTRYMKLAKGAKCVLPLSIYDHSLVSMWVGQPYTDSYRSWDSSFVGAIVAFPEDIEATGVPEDSIEEVLRGEVETFSQFLQGEIYGYEIVEDEEVVDSCFGFYGIEEAKQEAEAANG